jgi:hypothetical protein
MASQASKVAEYSTGRIFRWIRVTAEGCVYLAAAGALVLLARQTASLVEFVTVGPVRAGVLGIDGLAVLRLFERLGLSRSIVVGREVANASAVLLAVTAALLWVRTRRSRGLRFATIVVQGMLGMAMIGVSYRFVALVGVLCVAVWQVWRPRLWVVWVLWGASIGTCVLPVDLTLRNFPGEARLVETGSCSTASAYERYAAGTMQYVCVDWGQSLYFAPRAAWVW